MWLGHWLGRAELPGLLFGRVVALIMIEPSNDGLHVTGRATLLRHWLGQATLLGHWELASPSNVAWALA